MDALVAVGVGASLLDVERAVRLFVVIDQHSFQAVEDWFDRRVQVIAVHRPDPLDGDQHHPVGVSRGRLINPFAVPSAGRLG